MNGCQICGAPKEGNSGPFCEACLAYDPDDIFVTIPDRSRTGSPAISEDGTGSASTDLDDYVSSFSPDTVGSCPEEEVRKQSLVLQRRRQHTGNEPYTSVNLRPSQQAQMLSDFLNSHFPTVEARAGLAYRSSYLAALPDMDISTNPLLRSAIDTLCFAHIGSKIGDQRLLQESQTSYGKVLTTLIRATNAPSNRVQMHHMDPKDVLISVMLLALYDDSVPSQFRIREDWGTHYWGAMQLLQAYGPSVLNLSEPLDRLIFANLRMPSFFAAVARRKGIVLGEPQWLAKAESTMELKFANLTGFYRTAMPIPNLLERTDRVIETRVALSDVETLVIHIDRIRAEIKSWYQAKVNRPNGSLLQAPEAFNVLDEADAFDMDIDEHRVIALSDTFTSAFRFKTSGYLVKNHTYMLILSLLLDCTLLRIFHFRPEVLNRHMTWDETCRSAYKNAADICRSVYHYSRLPGLPNVDFVNFLVEMAQNFFEEVGSSKEIEWCRALRSALHERRERIKRTVQARTLCRMADSGPGFAAAMHFRKPTLAVA